MWARQVRHFESLPTFFPTLKSYAYIDNGDKLTVKGMVSVKKNVPVAVPVFQKKVLMQILTEAFMNDDL